MNRISIISWISSLCNTLLCNIYTVYLNTESKQKTLLTRACIQILINKVNLSKYIMNYDTEMFVDVTVSQSVSCYIFWNRVRVAGRQFSPWQQWFGSVCLAGCQGKRVIFLAAGQQLTAGWQWHCEMLTCPDTSLHLGLLTQPLSCAAGAHTHTHTHTHIYTGKRHWTNSKWH